MKVFEDTIFDNKPQIKHYGDDYYGMDYIDVSTMNMARFKVCEKTMAFMNNKSFIYNYGEHRNDSRLKILNRELHHLLRKREFTIASLVAYLRNVKWISIPTICKQNVKDARFAIVVMDII